MKKCKLCGDPTPGGKELCWCCEHTPKLHPTEPKHEKKCTDDSCSLEVKK